MAGETTYFGNMIVRDSTFVFINLEFDFNISDEQLPSYLHSKTTTMAKTSPRRSTVLNLVLIHTMLYCESHARYARKQRL
jgi:hypothetical protein